MGVFYQPNQGEKNSDIQVTEVKAHRLSTGKM